MQEFPHHYSVEAAGGASGSVAIRSQGLPELSTAAPAEFGGPGDQWSPETLFAAAVADCFVLSFRAVATASSFAWESIECSVEAVLDKVERVTRFTTVIVRPRLVIGADADEQRAHRLLEKSEKVCLVTNSLSAEVRLEASVERA